MDDPSTDGRECVIRARRDVDMKGAANALVAVHTADGYPVEGVAHPEEWLSPRGLVMAWVSDMDGRIVGHVAVSRPNGEEAAAIWMRENGARNGSVAVLARLFVLPNARMRSIGQQLMATATEYAHRQGMRLVLDVMVKDMSAIRLYERLGWRRSGGQPTCSDTVSGQKRSVTSRRRRPPDTAPVRTAGHFMSARPNASMAWTTSARAPASYTASWRNRSNASR